MSNIEVKISEVKNLSAELGPCYNKVSSIADSINSVRGNLDSRITARRNIGSRLSSAYNEAKSIQSKLKALQKFIDESMNRYETADKKVEEQANALRILMDLRMRTGMEFDLISQMSGTSSAYVSENDKIFYDGDKVSDDDEDIDEVLKETDDLLKEINEEEDNDWRNKPAKKDIFDKFTDWLNEKLTGEKPRPKTQGEEVIDAQLTTMSFDEQSILADIAGDYQTAFRGLASADRINEALENFEEEPVFSSGNNTNVISKDINIKEISTLLKTDPDTAFFWSGRTNGIGGADRAAEIAKAKSGVTLESTIADKSIQMPEWDFNNPNSIKAWEDASAEYARQVSGEVRAVVGKQLREGNIWENVELPRLKNNPNVTKITTIDPETGKETVIFER